MGQAVSAALPVTSARRAVLSDKADREGPRIIITRSCDGCRWVRSSYYAIQGDSGFDVSCGHPSWKICKSIGDARWATPDWCPCLEKKDVQP